MAQADLGAAGNIDSGSTNQTAVGAIGVIASGPGSVRAARAPKIFEAHAPLLKAPPASAPFSARNNPTPVSHIQMSGSPSRGHSAPIQVSSRVKAEPLPKTHFPTPHLTALKTSPPKAATPPKVTPPKAPKKAR